MISPKLKMPSTKFGIQLMTKLKILIVESKLTLVIAPMKISLRALAPQHPPIQAVLMLSLSPIVGFPPFRPPIKYLARWVRPTRQMKLLVQEQEFSRVQQDPAMDAWILNNFCPI